MVAPPENCDPDLRFYRLATLAFIVATFVVKAYLVFSGTILSSSGDDSNRIYQAIRWSLDPSITFSSKFFTDIWPHGQKIVMGVPLMFFRMIGLEQSINPVKVCLLETALVYSVCAYLVFSIVSRLIDPRSGFFAVTGLFAMEIQNRLALSGMAETYCLLLILIAVYCLLEWKDGNLRSKWFALATLFSLLSTLFRGDMIFFIGIFGFVILCQRRILPALIYWGVSYSFFVGKKAYQLLLSHDGISYLNADEFYDFGDGSLGQRSIELAQFCYDAFIYSPALVVYLAGFIGLVLLLFRPKTRIIPWVFVLYTAPFIAAMLAGRMYFQERMLFFSYVLIAMGAGYAVSVTVMALKERNRVTISQATAFLYFAFCLLPFVHSHWEMAHRTPKGVRLAVDWLRENRKPGEIVHYDFLEFWEHVLLVNSCSLGNLPPDYTYSNVPGSKISAQTAIDSVASPIPKDRMDLQTTLRAHLHLTEYRPKYIFLAGPELWKELRAVEHWHGKHLRSSYLRPYLSETRRERVWEFQSDLLNHPPFKLERIYSNDEVEIYESVFPVNKKSS